MPWSDPGARFMMSSAWTIIPLLDSKRSRVRLPARASWQSEMTRSLLLCVRTPKPPLSTLRAPMASMIVPAPFLWISHISTSASEFSSCHTSVPAAMSSGPT